MNPVVKLRSDQSDPATYGVRTVTNEKTSSSDSSRRISLINFVVVTIEPPLPLELNSLSDPRHDGSYCGW
jgi:hypothetical protein